MNKRQRKKAIRKHDARTPGDTWSEHSTPRERRYIRYLFRRWIAEDMPRIMTEVQADLERAHWAPKDEPEIVTITDSPTHARFVGASPALEAPYGEVVTTKGPVTIIEEA